MLFKRLANVYNIYNIDSVHAQTLTNVQSQ